MYFVYSGTIGNGVRVIIESTSASSYLLYVYSVYRSCS